MDFKRRQRSYVGVAALVALLGSTVATAYVLPAYSILRRMVERRDDLRLSNLRVMGTATFPVDTNEDAAAALNVPADRELQVDAVVALKLPGRCRMALKVPEGGASASVMAHGRRRVEGKEIAAVSNAVSQICPLIALRSASEGEAREAVERHLRALGVDTKKTSLARFDSRIVYVVGNRAAGQPQFWIYKDVFLPARILYKDEQGTAWDVRFRDFGSPVAGDWFPRVVEVHRGDRLVLRFTALAADASVKLDDKLF